MGKCPEKEYLLEEQGRDENSQWKRPRAPRAGFCSGSEQPSLGTVKHAKALCSFALD